MCAYKYDEKQFGKYAEADLRKDDLEDYVVPEFSIDPEGRVICEAHTEIASINRLKEKSDLVYQYEALLTCKTCKHYKYDDCYFPKDEIDKIEKDRKSGVIHCVLCGNRIDRPLTVIHSLYNQNEFGIDIPLICCSCYASLNDNSYLKNIKKRMFFVTISLIISAYFLISYFVTILMFSFWGILLFLIPFLFWGYISVRDLKNFYYLWKGRQYYKEMFGERSPEHMEIKEDKNEET